MASITLYNKWRPQTFAAPERHPLIGQEHVTRTLRNAVARNQIAHAYLFCGPRGTGKTSAARILARAVNCRRGLQGEPCNECENCQALLTGRQLDLLIEIDGASNRGVDDVRQLRERLMQRPGGADLTGRFKVYIIDEVHMLTQEAFNALLKSLEEPPAHVIFILATTDPQKVPATVASRCQRFDFKPISLETLVAHLVHVAAAEGVRLQPEAAELLAQAAAGGARDAISLLDQALAFTGATRRTNGAADAGGAIEPLTLGAPSVTVAHVQGMLGLTGFDAVCRLLDALIERDLPTGLRLVHEVADQGVDLRQLTRQIIDFLRALLLAQSDAATLLHLDEERQEAISQRARRLTLADLVRLIRLFTLAEQGLKSPSAQPQLPLELAIVEASLSPTAAPIPIRAEADGPGAPRPQPPVAAAPPQH
ncbi:MAG: DNA polymerase III subunit gamma/tau, partial [Chloroflexota bacterium]|nr:DNA polymerase III subunit gamma/tau [Chloroflexota bacterium]